MLTSSSSGVSAARLEKRLVGLSSGCSRGRWRFPKGRGSVCGAPAVLEPCAWVAADPPSAVPPAELVVSTSMVPIRLWLPSEASPWLLRRA